MNNFQEWCKEILPVVQAAADGQVIEARFRSGGEWVESQYDWGAFGYSREYRIKRKTVVVNGFDVPEPMNKIPPYGTPYFIPSVTNNARFEMYTWTDHAFDKTCFTRRVAHSDQDAAIAHSMAMTWEKPNA